MPVKRIHGPFHNRELEKTSKRTRGVKRTEVKRSLNG